MLGSQFVDTICKLCKILFNFMDRVVTLLGLLLNLDFLPLVPVHTHRLYLLLRDNNLVWLIIELKLMLNKVDKIWPLFPLFR